MDIRPALEVENIEKRFGGIKALKNVSFSVLQGEVHALLGENGAGKSTLIKILTGVHEPNGGKILLGGKETSIRSTIDAKNKGIAAIYQELSLIDSLSVAENIFLGNEPTEPYTGYYNKKRLYAQSEAYLNQFGIELNSKVKVEELGMGQKRIVEIVKALVSDAKILLLDEPTTGMSKAEINILFKIMNSLREKKVTMIYISHYLDEVFQICDRATVLRDGENVADYKMKDTNTAQVIKSMIGKELGRSADRIEKDLSGKQPILSLVDFKTDIMQAKVNLFVRESEVLGITGIVGAGKSELAHSIFGHAHVESGQMKIYDENVHLKSPYSSKKYKIAFLPEDRKTEGLFLQDCAADNMVITNLELIENKMKLLSNKKKQELAIDMMTKLQVSPLDPKLETGNFSGGNQQKVVIGKWLMGNPNLIIMDEPTRGIDIGAKGEIHRLIRNLAQGGKAVLVMSSEFEELIDLCDRILVMYKGKIVKDFKTKDATSEMLLTYSLGGVDDE